jgi:hypothetical protein
MNTRLFTLIRKGLYVAVLVAMLLFIYAAINGSPAAGAQENKYFSTRTFTSQNGQNIDETRISGPPVPPPGYEVERRPVALPKTNLAAGIVTLSVPAYRWSFGCSATSGSMIAAYYDRLNYPNMYSGPTNGGVMPLDSSPWPDWTDGIGDTYAQCPLTATRNGLDGRLTRGSIDDYWVSYLSNAQDPYLTNGWTQHTWGEAIGDYMKTSQSAYDNVDGSTVFYNWTVGTSRLTCTDMETNNITVDGTYGRHLFYEARGYTVTDCYNQKTGNNSGFTFTLYKAEIDAGRPVLINLAGHSIVGVGYDDSTKTVYLHDTWDYLTHTMSWGGSYSGMRMQSVSIVNLTVPVTYSISGNAGTNNATISYNGGSTNTDGTGAYAFTVASGWSGTVTPSKTGYTFDPASRSYTNVTINQTAQDYTATQLQSIPLVTGWNLVSFRLHPADTSITSVLSSLSGQYSLVYAWDATSAAWRIYDPTLGALNDLNNLDESMGFWIRMNTDLTLVVSGTAPASSSIALRSGWNLVGYPSVANAALPGVLSDHGLGGDFSLVYAYHASEGSAAWKLYDLAGNPLLNDLTELAPGWGYWIKTSADHTWSVP